MYKINEERLLERFLTYVKIPSPSWEEKNIIQLLTRELKKLKLEVYKYPCDPSVNILAKLPGDITLPTIVFSCHTDTVTPCEEINPIVQGNKITSDGTSILGADDKAAIAVFLEAIEYIQEHKLPHGPIEFLFSCAEEIGLKGIKGFDLTLLNAKYAFVFDSTGSVGKVVIKAPYQKVMDLQIKGKAAHAGLEPEKGLSAIMVLANIISKLPHGRIDSETTVNVGTIFGGKATNIVAEDAGCKLEFRSTEKEKLQKIESKIKNIIKKETSRTGAKFTLKNTLEYPGFSLGKEDRIVKIVSEAAAKINIPVTYESTGGGSDTNIINTANIKAVNLAIGMMNPHSTKEYIMKKDLINGTKLVLSIVESITKKS